MSAWIAALRIARREALRARRRSALVLAMIVLPVAVLSFAAVITDMFQLTAEERFTRYLGTADASVSWVSDYPIQQQPDGSGWSSGQQMRTAIATEAEILAKLPQGSRVTPVGFADPSRLSVALMGFSGRVIDLGDPLTAGIGSIVDGRAPEGPDEIALTVAAADELGVSIGDSVTTEDPQRRVIVTGLAEFPDDLGACVIMPPGSVEPFSGRVSQPTEWLVASPVPLEWEDILRLNQAGIVVTSRKLMQAPPGFAGSVDLDETFAVGVLLFGLVVLEVVLLTGPAFAVGARRRARDLALVAAAGAEPKHLRRIVLADGIVLGVAGATIGIAVGVFGAIAGRPLAEEFLFGSRAGGWRFMPWALFAIALLAVGTGAAAAAAPAWTAARQDVVAVLSGRRPVVRSKRRWIVVGLAMAGAGVLFALTGAIGGSEALILFGIVLGELGLVLITPALIGLVSRLGRWMPLAPRLALRDTARNRSAAAPAVSAIMAAVAGAVSVGVFVAGSERQEASFYEPAIPVGHAMVEPLVTEDARLPDRWQVEAVVRETLPVDGIYTYQVPTCGGLYCDLAVVAPSEATGWPGQWITASIVDDGGTLAALTDVDPADQERARETLRQGGVVVPDARFLDHNGYATVVIMSKLAPEPPSPSIQVPGVVLTGVPSRLQALVSTSAAAQLGVGTRLAGFIVSTERPPSEDEERQLNLRLNEFDSQFATYVERGYVPYSDPMAIVLAVAAALIALGAAAIATGLATADRRTDMATLAAVGADPRLRRGLSLSQAGVISVLGAGLGMVAGLAGSGAMIFALNRLASMQASDPIPFAMPWPTLAITIAVPLVAMAGAGLLTRSWLPIERRF